jgi:hypothetical protein
MVECLNAINPKRTIVPTCPRQIAINIVIDNIRGPSTGSFIDTMSS